MMAGVVLYTAASLLVGCLSCFFGKRLYFPILMFTVWFTVMSAGLGLFGANWQVAAASAIAGLALALLARFLYKLGVFLLGCLLGAGAGLLLASLLPSGGGSYRWAPALALALVSGVCAVRWCGVFIMAATAYNGASAIATPLCFLALEAPRLGGYTGGGGAAAAIAGLDGYLHGPFAAQNAQLLLACTLVLAAAGFAVQYRAGRRGL